MMEATPAVIGCACSLERGSEGAHGVRIKYIAIATEEQSPSLPVGRVVKEATLCCWRDGFRLRVLEEGGSGGEGRGETPHVQR